MAESTFHSPGKPILPGFVETTLDANGKGVWTNLPAIFGMIALNGQNNRLETQTVDGTNSGIVTDYDHHDEHDAYVDDTYGGGVDNVYHHIHDAIDDGHVSIMIKSAGDTAAITIASGDSVQRLQGKDADTTDPGVAITVDKDDVTLEQLKFSTANVTGTGLSRTIKECYVGAGVTITAKGEGFRLVGCRLAGSTATAVVSIEDDFVAVTDSRWLSPDSEDSCTNFIVMAITSNNLVAVRIADNYFDDQSSRLAGAVVNTTGASPTQYLFAPIVQGNLLRTASNGGLVLTGNLMMISNNVVNNADSGAPGGAGISPWCQVFSWG